MNISGRGGNREGSGRPSRWKNQETVAIRVPKCLSDQILEYAQKLDKEEHTDNVQIQKALLILNEGLPLPANKGGSIKVKIRQAIHILENVQNQ